MKRHRILDVRFLTDSTFVVRMERNGLDFQTGQFILLGLNNEKERREYSVYSGEGEDFIEVLVREIDYGKVSGKLKKLQIGETVEVEGPFGFFKFNPKNFQSEKFLFIASGTGISPFHSFVKSHPGMDYKLVHGARFGHEAYDHPDFEQERIVFCTSGDSIGGFDGRVTDYLYDERIDSDTHCFLCGNSEMIYEVFDILTGKGVPISNIYSEVYF